MLAGAVTGANPKVGSPSPANSARSLALAPKRPEMTTLTEPATAALDMPRPPPPPPGAPSCARCSSSPGRWSSPSWRSTRSGPPISSSWACSARNTSPPARSPTPSSSPSSSPPSASSAPSPRWSRRRSAPATSRRCARSSRPGLWMGLACAVVIVPIVWQAEADPPRARPGCRERKARRRPSSTTPCGWSSPPSPSSSSARSSPPTARPG